MVGAGVGVVEVLGRKIFDETLGPGVDDESDDAGRP